MMLSNAKVVFLGTPKFALPSLEALIQNGYQLAAVITNPDEPAGRKQELTPPPVKILAKKHHIPVFQPEKLEVGRWKSEIPEADLYVVVAYGKIIPKEILEIPKFGALNIHPSLLPRWRGPSPIQYTILHGDAEAGVTLMKIDEQMDHGPILAQQKLEAINNQLPVNQATYKELHDELARIGAELLIETLPKYLSGEITSVPQDDAKATFSKLLRKDDGRADWKKPAEEIERRVRALNPWPGTWTLWPTASKILRVKIEEASTTDEEPAGGSPGYVWQNSPSVLLVKTGKGSIAIKKMTLEGKNSLTSGEILRGYPKVIGSAFV